MDASTSTAIAALVVAVVAFFIALAQALQQYFITGQSIRLCDSVVYDDMPGQGHRVWQMSQFRFRVVYSVPQISLSDSFWPSDWPQSFKERKHRLPNLSENPMEAEFSRANSLTRTRMAHTRTVPQVGEKVQGERTKTQYPRRHDHAQRPIMGPRTGKASWVSFCRIIHHSSRHCVRYDFAERDADRCPADLPTIPMQLSMRDIAILALNTGMKCTDASFQGKSLSMQGAAGILTTSQHPILGPLIHFTPGNMNTLHGIRNTGKISHNWVARTWGMCPVANYQFGVRRMRDIEKDAGLWIHRVRNSNSKKPTKTRAVALPREPDGGSNDRKKIVVIGETSEILQTLPVDHSVRLSMRKGAHDGDWMLKETPAKSPPPRQHIPIFPPQQTVSPNQQVKNPNGGPSIEVSGGTSALPKKTGDHNRANPYQATVEDDAEESNIMMTGVQQEAHKIQIGRNERAARIADDELVVARLDEKSNILHTNPGQRLLPWKSGETSNAGDSETKGKEVGYLPTPAEQEAIDREAERKEEQRQRDLGRCARTDEQSRVVAIYGELNWFWLSQIDIIPGFWATPWKSFQGLNSNTCSGAVTCILSALDGFVDSSSLRYVRPWEGIDTIHGFETISWMLDGHVTFPGYAHNARGGVVCSGTYPAVKLEVFKECVPTIELMNSYEYQVSTFRPSDGQTCGEHLLELMRLDGWLSICGRTDEILHGRNDLGKQTPAMVQLLMTEFEYDFLNVYQSDFEGGMQQNRELAANVTDFLLDEELSGAEQLFVLVAVLRTMKVGQCILDGQDTRMIEQILVEDIQVHLV